MAGRGPQSFKKRQKEQQRKEKQQEKAAKRAQRAADRAAGITESDLGDVRDIVGDMDFTPASEGRPHNS